MVAQRLAGKLLEGRRAYIGALIVVSATILAAIVMVGPTGVRTECGSAQARVDAAEEGSTVDLPDGCIYRETLAIDKRLTLVGGPGVEIRGSDVWTRWRKQDNGRWVSWLSVPDFSPVGGKCATNTSRCRWPEQVFFDGRALEQMATQPGSGQFSINGNRKVVLANDPRSKRVEVTTRERWIVGRSGGVTIDDLDMRHAANGINTGSAIKSLGHPNWTVKNSELAWAHAGIISLPRATGGVIQNNDIHHSGQIALGGFHSTDLRVLNNEIHHNNIEGFSQSWEAGAMKLARATDAVVQGNEIHDNRGNGVWFDGGCTGGTVSNNRIYRNTRNGIHYEVSDGGPSKAEIVSNKVYDNGWTDDGASLRSGIMVTASKNVEVYNNILAWNANGIKVIAQKRGPHNPWYAVRSVSLHDNTMLHKDYVGFASYALSFSDQTSNRRIFSATADNGGANNRYWFPVPEGKKTRYAWGGIGYKRLVDFEATPADEDGRYLSDAEKEEIVSSVAIPPAPEPHRAGRGPQHGT
jgi:hypothetical protein